MKKYSDRPTDRPRRRPALGCLGLGGGWTAVLVWVGDCTAAVSSRLVSFGRGEWVRVRWPPVGVERAFRENIFESWKVI